MGWAVLWVGHLLLLFLIRLSSFRSHSDISFASISSMLTAVEGRLFEVCLEVCLDVLEVLLPVFLPPKLRLGVRVKVRV